jgi:hypothetical protein
VDRRRGVQTGFLDRAQPHRRIGPVAIILWMNRAKPTTGRHTGPDASNHRRPRMKRPSDPPVTALVQPSSHRRPRPGRHDPSPAASWGTALRGRGTSNVLSYRHATSPIRAVPDTPQPTLLVSRVISALAASCPFASHSNADLVGHNGSGRRPLVRACVEPPAGIEPATPSLPSMRRWFTTPCDTSHPYTTAQVRTAVEGCVVRRDEAASSRVSGKFLARAAVWSLAPAGALTRQFL